jgi:hypothetical protein
MAGKDKNYLALAAAGGIAAAVIALRRRVAQEPTTIVGLDQATLDLLAAIGTGVAGLDELLPGKLDEILAALGATPGGVSGVPPNLSYIRTFRVVGTVAPAAPQAFPQCFISDGMSLLVKGYPTNLALVYVGGSSNSAGNVNSSYPLQPGEVVRYFIKDSSTLYLRVINAGESVICTVEQPNKEA